MCSGLLITLRGVPLYLSEPWELILLWVVWLSFGYPAPPCLYLMIIKIKGPNVFSM